MQKISKKYNKPRSGKKRWSVKYKKDIDCNNPKGFSQKQYCKRKKRGGDYKKSRLKEIQEIHKKYSVPYSEAKGFRIFSANVDPDDLVWHRDEEDREILIVSGDNWKIQFDNQIPKSLEMGKIYHIKKEAWHRIIKGSSDLIIKIKRKFDD